MQHALTQSIRYEQFDIPLHWAQISLQHDEQGDLNSFRGKSEPQHPHVPRHHMHVYGGYFRWRAAVSIGTNPRHLGCAGWPLGHAIGVSILNFDWPRQMPHPGPGLFGLTTIAAAEAAAVSASCGRQKEILFLSETFLLSIHRGPVSRKTMRSNETMKCKSIISKRTNCEFLVLCGRHVVNSVNYLRWRSSECALAIVFWDSSDLSR